MCFLGYTACSFESGLWAFPALGAERVCSDAPYYGVIDGDKRPVPVQITPRSNTRILQTRRCSYSGGHIQIEFMPGKGTSVHFYCQPSKHSLDKKQHILQSSEDIAKAQFNKKELQVTL